jgi:sarcosine oxidase subunit gamma
MPISPRTSPIHHLFESQSDDVERAAMKVLSLCDLSALTKLGVKGSEAEGWLREQDVEVPEEIYESRRFAEGGLIVRLGPDEFLLESGVVGESMVALAARLESTQGQVSAVPREDATFLMTGSRAIDVLAQTCGVNFRGVKPQRLILTRVAGVSCGILPETISNVQAYRLWIDPTYAIYLWGTLVEICESLDGTIIGAGCIFPELLS